MATNRFSASFDALSDSLGQIPGGTPSRFTATTGRTKAGTSTLLYSNGNPGFLSLVAFLDAAASGGAIDVYLGPDNTYPKFMVLVNK